MSDLKEAIFKVSTTADGELTTEVRTKEEVNELSADRATEAVLRERVRINRLHREVLGISALESEDRVKVVSFTCSQELYRKLCHQADPTDHGKPLVGPVARDLLADQLNVPRNHADPVYWKKFLKNQHED